jgi:hypothetical protein
VNWLQVAIFFTAFQSTPNREVGRYANLTHRERAAIIVSIHAQPERRAIRILNLVHR